MSDIDDDDDATPEGLVDQDALNEIMDRAKDALRSLGLTLQTEGIVVQMQQGHVYAMMPVIVRASAKKKLTEDKKSKEDFNKFLAAQNEAETLAKAEAIRKVAGNMEDLEKFLFSDEEPTEEEAAIDACQHLRRHPDGFCLDCGDGWKNE